MWLVGAWPSALAWFNGRSQRQISIGLQAEIVSRTVSLSGNAQKIAKNCIRLAVHEQARGAQAEIEGIWTLMRSSETKKRVHGFLRN